MARMMKMSTFLSPNVLMWHPSLLNSKPSMVRRTKKLKSEMMTKVMILQARDTLSFERVLPTYA